MIKPPLLSECRINLPLVAGTFLARLEMSELASQLRLLVTRDGTRHLVKRFCSLGQDGRPDPRLLSSPPHQFVDEVINQLHTTEEAIQHGEVVLRQLKLMPPVEWLQKIGISRSDYVQQQVDGFTTVVYSVLDRALILTNTIYQLQYDARKCTFRSISDALEVRDSIFVEKLGVLKKAVDPLADHRHFYVHRGENRKVELFSDVRRLEQLVDVFQLPTVGLILNEVGAFQRVIEVLEGDIGRVKIALIQVLNVLADPYCTAMHRLGGIKEPTQEEVLKAGRIMQYWSSEDRPMRRETDY